VAALTLFALALNGCGGGSTAGTGVQAGTVGIFVEE
jgi:hypothetical protein